MRGRGGERAFTGGETHVHTQRCARFVRRGGSGNAHFMDRGGPDTAPAGHTAIPDLNRTGHARP